MPFDKERKPINLGGTSSSISLEKALDEAKRQRLGRENARKRDQAATKLQAWWRKTHAQNRTQTQCQRGFDVDPSTLVALRSLVLLPYDVGRMHLWTTTMCNDDGLLLLKRLASKERHSWMILIRQLSPRFLQFMADFPSSPIISTYLHLVNFWLSVAPTTAQAMPGDSLCDRERSSAISYMLSNGYHASLCKIITSMRKSFSSSPLLMQLVMLPLRLLHESSDRNSYTEALLSFALHILPIPRLASRLTKPVLETFSVDIGLFLEDLALLIPVFSRIESETTQEFSIYSLSNLMLFTPPRYSQLSAPCYDVYLRLVTILLNQVPGVILEGSKGTECEDSWSYFCATKHGNLPSALDSKTRTRLARILSSEHIYQLLNAADCTSKMLSLVTYLPQLCLSWPSQVRNVLDAVAASDVAVPFTDHLYVEKVSAMPLCKTSVINPIKLIGSENFEHWARFLFFMDLFIHLNQRMNDDEFYGTMSDSEPEPIFHNPLEVSQLQTFLKQLCTIVYVLDRLPLKTHASVTRGKFDWTQVTARLKDSLVVLYCREVRRGSRSSPRPPSSPKDYEPMGEAIHEDFAAEDARLIMQSFSPLPSLPPDAFKRPSDKILESDPSRYQEILAQQDLEDNIRLFSYFSWPERMPRDVLFPHRLGDFYLMRFERTEDKFKTPESQQHRDWLFNVDACNQILQCYEAALDLAPPDYPVKVDLLQKLAFMYLWRFETHMNVDDCRRASVYLQDALDLDPSFSCRQRTISISWWFFHGFAVIEDILRKKHGNASLLDQFFQTRFPFLQPGRTWLEDLAKDVAKLGDHPVFSLTILAIERNVEVMTPHSFESLAAWYFRRYQYQDQAEDLNNAIRMQTTALMQKIKTRDKEMFEEQRSGVVEGKRKDDEDESENEGEVGEVLEPAEQGTFVTNETEVNVPNARKKFQKRRRERGGDKVVVDCGLQLAQWLKLRYEVRPSKEDLQDLRDLLSKMVMSYRDPGGMLEGGFIFSKLPPPPQLPYELYDRAIFGLHLIAVESLQMMGTFDMFLRFHDPTVFISNIVAMALRDNNPIKAVEWLENSRCVIWNILSIVEETPVQLDFERRHVLQGCLYVDGNRLLRHLTNGPVIVLNASTVGCDALILRPNVYPQRLHLENLSLDQVTAWEDAFVGLVSSLGALARDERKDRPSKRSRDNGDDDFRNLLAEIWVALVEPILNFVWGRKDSLIVSEKTSLPRVWWCCTGPFFFLPIHAAGLYTSFGPQVRLSDFAVSSYIPSLISAVTRPTPNPPADFKLLVIAQPSTPDFPPLPGVTEEVSNIMKHKKSSHTTVVLNGEEATGAAVRLEAASAPWVHAACHGQQSAGIGGSRFALHDGVLTVQRLASLPHLSQAEFAFLSACETATGDRHLSDEALHLAGGLFQLGYRSVIATMFSVRDRDAPFVADKVYEQLFKDERPDYRKAAHTLNRAIHLLQEADGRGNFRAWVPFIHIGM